jgi:glutamate synthase (ferredoxin)
MSYPALNASLDHDACGVGFVAQLGGEATRDVVERSLVALDRLSHRGGVDSDGLSGDGAGLLLPIPRVFFRAQSLQLGFSLPENCGLGMAFLPPGHETEARGAIESLAQLTGLRCLGWRDVPVNPTILGSLAASTKPSIRQCFFGSPDAADDIERQLFFLRKRVEAEGLAGTYFCSLSSRTVVYKGLLTPSQFRDFYLDLTDPNFRAPFTVFHQRYSTNTQPSWTMAQPFRYVAHNGEINTISANRRWMRARERKVRCELETGEWFRTLEDRVSDSASFDNGLEILRHRGYHIAAAMLRMVPPASESGKSLESPLNDFLQEESFQQEPWDGPAALVFTDGKTVGAKLDRNGLRPMRYCVTSDGLVIAGSEAGLTDLQNKEIIERQRLGPGEMFLVDPAAGRCFLQADFAQFLPARENPRARKPVSLQPTRTTQMNSVKNSILEPKRVASALGWSEDQYRLLFEPLGTHAKEATWSMGDDASPAFLSAMRRPLWDYCKQRFAQVTNPPIDPLREGYVMSLDVHLSKRLVIPSPLLDLGQLAALRSRPHRPVRSISFTFEAAGGVRAAIEALQRVRDEASDSEGRAPGMILLSDRGINAERAALPALLALAAAWKALVGAGACDVPLVIETGQVIETHHLAMLIAAGASAVCPYLALELSESAQPKGAARYREAVNVGLGKVLARMGICMIGSYRNSQLFEIVGLNQDVRDEFFEDAGGALGGKSLEELLKDSLERHASAFALSAANASSKLRDEGLYRFRQTGERHSSSPDLVRRMHNYVKSPTAENYLAYAELAETRDPVAVRDLFSFAPGKSIALEEVEPGSAILERFTTQAMSLGALGPEAHRTLAIAMNRLGARSNTGEGGEDPDVYRTEPEAANPVKQVASARFGVTAEYLVRANELEIKMAQGSKPGEGGQLPAAKVTPLIARLRHAVPGMSLISPPPHHDIYSIEDLAQLIHDLRAVNPLARIGVKLVSGSGLGIIAAGVAKAGADVITISGFDGGTGASPLTSIKNTGLPWEIGLREAHNTLLRSGYRSRVRLRVDGGFKSGRDVIVAALLGADEFGFGTAALIAIGCIMARQCHLNTCPVGIATQNEEFRARFEGKPEMVMSYFRGVAEEVRGRLAQLGEQSLAGIIGQAERLQPKNLTAAQSLGSFFGPSPKSQEGSPGPASCEWTLDNMLIAHLDSESAVPAVFPIENSDRSVGAYLSGHILRRTSFAGLGDQQHEIEFSGTAGQSFGAFLIPGLTFRLHGEANDYVGKGLSGGTMAISAGADASRRADLLVGNTVLYGATSGELYVAGRAGERFAVRNSGAFAVVEGVGHHACEYMTAGVVIILGPTGMNLGSGMTGGLVYVLKDLLASDNYNREFVHCTDACGPTPPGEDARLRRALEEHARQTRSPRAIRLLEAKGPLPLLRLEPVHLPCSLAQTWLPLLERWENRAPTAGIASAKFLHRIRLDTAEEVDESVA